MTEEIAPTTAKWGLSDSKHRIPNSHIAYSSIRVMSCEKHDLFRSERVWLQGPRRVLAKAIVIPMNLSRQASVVVRRVEQAEPARLLIYPEEKLANCLCTK